MPANGTEEIKMVKKDSKNQVQLDTVSLGLA
jgi:hypothetical protein